MENSSFVQTMKDWRRMCAAYSTDDDDCCKGCPVLDYRDHGCSAIFEMDVVDWKKYENAIAKWAAEHPEPVYPSIAKYFKQFGITIRRDGSLEADYFKANEPMSADMAKLLGISSGDGENEKTD